MELNRIAADVTVRGTGHFEVTRDGQNPIALIGCRILEMSQYQVAPVGSAAIADAKT